MTAKEFRKMALGLPDSAEGAHMSHADFRVRGKIFATLGHPTSGWAMVSVAPADQEVLVSLQPDCFVPAAGAWGRAGSTGVRLAKAKKGLVRQALEDAWRNKAPVALVREGRSARSRGDV